MHADGKSTLASISKWNSRKVNFEGEEGVASRLVIFMSEFSSLIQVVSCAKILCWTLLERINYSSFDLCVSVQNLQACL